MNKMMGKNGKREIPKTTDEEIIKLIIMQNDHVLISYLP